MFEFIKRIFWPEPIPGASLANPHRQDFTDVRSPITDAEKLFFICDEISDPFLTPWEVQFILDMKHRYGKFRKNHECVRLSRRQADKIDEIYKELLSDAYREYEQEIRDRLLEDAQCDRLS